MQPQPGDILSQEAAYADDRHARRGILMSGDPAPPLTAGESHYDLRGVLALRSIPKSLQDAEFSLGRYVHPTEGPRQPIGLPKGVVEGHIAVIGPPGSGKTTRIIVPWIITALRAGWRVVTIGARGDLVEHVQRAIKQSGQPLDIRPMVLDYTNPARSVRWNWLAEMDSDQAIDNAVKSILGREPSPKSDPYFFHLDSQILRGLLELVSINPQRDSVTASQLLEVLKDQGKLARVLAENPSSQAAARLRDLLSLGPDEYAKRVPGVAIWLDVLARPMVEAVTNRADMRAQDILHAPGFVSIVAPVQDGQLAAMLSSLFVNQLLFRAYNRFASPGRASPLLLVLDEAHQLESRVDFESLLSVAHAVQIAVVITVQDVKQFKNEHQRSIVFSNCGTMILLPGASSKTAELLRERVGQHPVQTSSVSVGPSSSVPGTSATPLAQTQLVTVPDTHETTDLPYDSRAAVVHSRELADRPFLVDLTTILERPDEPTAIQPSKQEVYDSELTGLYRKYAGRVLNFLLNMGCDQVLAEEIANDAFLGARRRWAYVRTLDEPEGYVFQIARNERSKRQKKHDDRAKDLHLDPPDALRNVDEDPAEGVADRELVRQALQQLPASQREAVTLRYVAGLSEAATAQIMEVSTGAVRRYTSEGNHKLRSLLAEFRPRLGRKSAD